jgi:hypothetical protein
MLMTGSGLPTAFTFCDSLAYSSSYGTLNKRIIACVFCMAIGRPIFLLKISALCIVWVKVMVTCCWLINKLFICLNVAVLWLALLLYFAGGLGFVYYLKSD